MSNKELDEKWDGKNAYALYKPEPERKETEEQREQRLGISKKYLAKCREILKQAEAEDKNAPESDCKDL